MVESDNGNAPAGSWKAGRGALGVMKPLLGSFEAEAAGPGPASVMHCTRSFEPILGGSYLLLRASWQTGPGRSYDELAVFGKGEDGKLSFHSFTSDGKKSNGSQCAADDVHPDAIAFEATMPAGQARMVYWPAEDSGCYYFAVESRTKKGWNRFMRHLYRPASGKVEL